MKALYGTLIWKLYEKRVYMAQTKIWSRKIFEIKTYLFRVFTDGMVPKENLCCKIFDTPKLYAGTIVWTACNGGLLWSPYMGPSHGSFMRNAYVWPRPKTYTFTLTCVAQWFVTRV